MVAIRRHYDPIGLFVPSAILAIATTLVFRILAILFDWKTDRSYVPPSN
jgi:hypothetical protein